MRVQQDRLLLSPSDLTAYVACEHLTQLELGVARDGLERPTIDDPQSDLIRRKGEQHEAAYLAQLRAEGRDVVEIRVVGDDGEWDWERAARETEDAMRGGREVV